MQFKVKIYKSACRIKEMFCAKNFLIPKSTMQMTYLQTQTLIMYRPTIENVKQKFKAVKERKQICDVASCHAWVASQEAHLFNVVCPTLHSVLRREITRFF